MFEIDPEALVLIAFFSPEKTPADIDRAAGYVSMLCNSKPSPCQFGALVSFVCDLGPGGLEISPILRALDANCYAEAAAQFIPYARFPGRRARSFCERDLFLGLGFDPSRYTIVQETQSRVIPVEKGKEV